MPKEKGESKLVVQVFGEKDLIICEYMRVS